MPSYAELQNEAVWRTQFTPQALLEQLILPLQKHYGLGPTLINAPGDNNHLYGRHRSRNWCLNSVWCTNRSYGTTNAKDQGGDGNWYRAIDIGITGPALYDACRRLDAAVRAGQLPGVAEWFGTFDGKVVVGWYQGRPSSSDSSHLWHGHIGFWNESANDAALMRQVFAVWTGQATTVEDDDMKTIVRKTSDKSLWLCDTMHARRITDAELADLRYIAKQGAVQLWNGGQIWEGLVPAWGLPIDGTGSVVAVDYDRIEADVRDAVADGLEGGAKAVRAEA